MNKIIAVEGICFAGKTTLTKELEKFDFARLYELSEKFENGAKFPPFPKNDDEAYKSDIWFVEQEIIRERDAILKSQNSSVVADRSFVSGLAFGYARQEIFKLGHINFQHNLLKKAFDDGHIHIPWLIYLNLDIDKVLERQRNDQERRIREYGQDAVNNVSIGKKEKEFFEKQIEYYARLFSKVSHLELDASQSLTDLIKQIEEWSKQLNSQFSPINIDIHFINPR